MSFTPEDLVTINDAIASGEMEVEFSDHKVKYRSMAELIRAKNHIVTALAKQQRRRPPGFRVSVSKGV